MDGFSARSCARGLRGCRETGRARRAQVRDGASGPYRYRRHDHASSRPLRLGRGRRGIPKVRGSSSLLPFNNMHGSKAIFFFFLSFLKNFNFLIFCVGTSIKFEGSWTATNRVQARAIWTCTRGRSAFSLVTSSRRAIWMTFRSPTFKSRIWRWRASISSPDPPRWPNIHNCKLGRATTICACVRRAGVSYG